MVVVVAVLLLVVVVVVLVTKVCVTLSCDVLCLAMVSCAVFFIWHVTKKVFLCCDDVCP